jgi:hypothetical protein
MPSGASSAYVLAGAPEVGGGYRQGTGGFELEARAALNWVQLALSLEAIAKVTVLRKGSFELAPQVGLGLVYDTGARYLDRANFQFFGLRPRVGVVGTMKFGETANGILAFDLPWAISVNPSGGTQAGALIGGGGEIYLGEDITGLVIGQLGIDGIKEPLGVTQIRLGYALKLGIGFRLF